MNQHKNKTQKQKWIKLYLVNFLFVMFTILVVAIATLYPFNFSFPKSFSTSEFLASFNNTSSCQDQVNNVLLFMPLGFCCANFLQKFKVKFILQIIIVFMLSASLSSTVEILQIFIPSRTPTPADIFNNTLGGCLGFSCFYLWNYQSLGDTVPQIQPGSLRKSNQRITGLALLSFFAKNRVMLSQILIPSGILFPSLILEVILINESDKSLSWKTLLLGIVFTAGTMLMLTMRADSLKTKG